MADNKQRITFVRYKTPKQTTGEAFEYHVEQSQDLQTWNKFGLTEESVIELGENMELSLWLLLLRLHRVKESSSDFESPPLRSTVNSFS